MDKSQTNRPKKNYFTHSQATISTAHPTQEFLSIIQLKKHYQSLIKQQLNALNSIQNAENNELEQWQHQLQKQVKVSPFQAKQGEESKPQKKIVVEKSTQQFVSCYDALKLIKMQKQFARLKQKMLIQRQVGVKSRAADYFSSHNVSRRWFTSWKQEAKQALTDAKMTKSKQIQLVNALKNVYFGRMIEQLRFEKKKKQYKDLINIGVRKTFLSRMCNLASERFVRIREQQALDQLKKKQAWTTLKIYIQTRRRVAQISMKSKLLNNIFCHRKFNIFFITCKQQKFKQEQAQITQEIIHKVDVLALITHSSEISQLPNQSSNQEALFPTNNGVIGKSTTLNVPLLNLILQNFVDEYSQEFSSNFSEQQRMFLLVELRSLIISELCFKQKCRFLLRSLALQLNQKRLSAKMQIYSLTSAVLQLKDMREHNICRKQVAKLVRVPREKQFIALLQMQYMMNEKKNKLQNSKVTYRWQARHGIGCLKQYKLNRQVLKLNREMAANWRKMHQYQLYFSLWIKTKQLPPSPHRQIILQAKQTENIQQPQIIQLQTVQRQEKNTDQNSNRQYEPTQKVTKAKLQLSKIVSAISKSMLTSKYSLDSYSKSIESQDSHHKFTQMRMKTQSAHHIDYDYDYEPKAVDLQLQKRVSIEDQLERQLQRKSGKLTEKIQQSRVMHCLRFMGQQYLYTVCIGKVVEARRKKQMVSLYQDYKYQFAIKQKMNDLLIYRRRVALSKCKTNSQSLHKSRNQVQRKVQIINDYCMQYSRKRVSHAVSSLSLRLRQHKQLHQFTRSKLVSRCKQFLKNAKQQVILGSAKRTLHYNRLNRCWQQFIDRANREAQPSQTQQQIDNQLQQEQISKHMAQSGEQQQESNHLANYLTNQEHQHQQQQLQHQQQYNLSEVNTKNHLKQYSPNTPTHPQHYAKSQVQITEPATTSPHIQTNSLPTYHDHVQSDTEEELWLQQQLNNKSHKKKQLHQQSNQIPMQKVQKEEERLGLDDSIMEDQPMYAQCKKIILRNNLLLLIQTHRSTQQRAISKQQQLQVVKYQLHKHDKQLKSKAFKALLGQVHSKRNTDLLVKCLKAWVMLTQQKRTLRHYLSLQNAAQEQTRSYYPTSQQQKQLFEYLKQQ